MPPPDGQSAPPGLTPPVRASALGLSSSSGVLSAASAQALAPAGAESSPRASRAMIRAKPLRAMKGIEMKWKLHTQVMLHGLVGSHAAEVMFGNRSMR